ncbi:hypothetical protein CHCC14598_0396 [Bacillus licheniformis]|nr:hypothetical protein CHCC20339_4083 [Bacillus licheniformis]TWL27200.1 hypothetical protein CHCC16874_3590 [Bacillus licheniformis]TWL69138.1 hypothetical protein CHCC15318_1880 [Bacillus licheniformis]TWM63910.1 hypothetical protein CHCC14813_2597 [Bacillus licheniformis]TWM71409.1 hypothetical protein CHCC14810_3961 [Bacillus licheniformis]
MKQMNRKLFKRAETLLLDEHQKKGISYICEFMQAENSKPDQDVSR